MKMYKKKLIVTKYLRKVPWKYIKATFLQLLSHKQIVLSWKMEFVSIKNIRRKTIGNNPFIGSLQSKNNDIDWWWNDEYSMIIQNKNHFWILLLQKRTHIVITPTMTRIKKNSSSYPSSPIKWRVIPITAWKIPTMRLPTTIERVESMFTSSFFPPTILMTSFEAIILKAPPRKAPQRALIMM